MKAIIDNAVYVKAEGDYLPKLYYLVSWNNYIENKST